MDKQRRHAGCFSDEPREIDFANARSGLNDDKTFDTDSRFDLGRVRRIPIGTELPDSGAEVAFANARREPVRSRFCDRDQQRFEARFRGSGNGGGDSGGRFSAGPEGDWSMSRQSPMVNLGMDGFDGERDIDFGNVRRGPVDAELGGPGPAARYVDFGAVRREPVEAEFAERDVDFGGTRKGPIEAVLGASGGRNVDFDGVRKRPIETDFGNTAGIVDFGSARKGPIEAKFVASRKDLLRLNSQEMELLREILTSHGVVALSRPSLRINPNSFHRETVDAETSYARGSGRDFGSKRRAPVPAEQLAKNTPPRAILVL